MRRAGWLTAATVLVTTVLGALVVSHGARPFSPQMPRAGLDPSWCVVTGEEAAKGTRWGIDIDFTYGPAAALATQYFASNYYRAILPLVAVVSMAFGACFAGLLLHRRVPGATAVSVARVVVAPVFVAMLANAWPDPFFFSFALLVFLAAMRVDDLTPVGRALTSVGAVGLGVAGISKLTYLLLSISLLAVADVYRVIERRVPALTLVCVAAAVATFVMLGQPLAGFPAFVAMGLDNVRWYSEAMSLVGATSEVAAFGVLGLSFVAAVGLLETRGLRTRRDRAAALLIVCGVGLFALLGFKEGFVRHDNSHAVIAWGALAGGIGVYAMSLTRARRAGAFAVCIVISLVGLLLPPIRYGLQSQEPRLLRDLARRHGFGLIARPMEEAASAARFIANPGAFIAALEAAKERAWADIRAQTPLPALAGSVDVIPNMQSALVANRLAYKPRPGFQEFKTFSPKLIEANRRYWSSARASDWLLFAPGSIDGRHPASAEGAQWPLLLRTYEPVARTAGTLVLKRRAAPLAELLGEPQVVRARIGDAVAVPAVDAPQFVTVTVRRSLLGSLMNLLLKTPQVFLRVRYDGGGLQRFRLIPAIARSGAILVPTIATPAQFAQLAGGDASPAGSRRPVSFAVVADGIGRLAYDAEVEFGFQAIDLAPLRAAATNPFLQQLAGLGWADAIFARTAPAPPMLDLTEEGVFAHPPSDLPLDTGGAQRIELGFGIRDGAWDNGGGTDGVCFSVVSGEGQQVLFARCLNPKQHLGDRGRQTASIDLPPGLATLRLRTECRANCSWDWSYWSNATLVAAPTGAR